jgi:hypothetical protein
MDRVFGPAIDLGMALLPAIAFDLGDGNALDADARERVADFFQFERFDDGNDELHERFPRCRWSVLTARQAITAARKMGRRQLAHDIDSVPEN